MSSCAAICSCRRCCHCPTDVCTLTHHLLWRSLRRRQQCHAAACYSCRRRQWEPSASHPAGCALQACKVPGVRWTYLGASCCARGWMGWCFLFILHPAQTARGCRGFSTFTAGSLATWLRDLLPRALSWAASHDQAVATTTSGTLGSLLSHMLRGAATLREFARALARGLGANMAPNVRAQFMQELTR